MNQTLLIVVCAALLGMPTPAPAQTAGAAPTTPSGLRPYTLDDYLALEDTHDGAASGTRIVWEQAPPYDERGYYGLGHLGAWDGTGFRLRTLDLSSSDPSAQPLFEAEPGTSYWIDSFSPDGRYVAFYAARGDVFFMGTYDTKDERVHTFEPTPLVHWAHGRESVWISPEEFVYCAYVGDRQPLAAARPYTGRRQSEEWEKAWSGGLSVSIESSALDAGKQDWMPGRLFRANARTGALVQIADGLYKTLKVSASGRFLAGLRQGDLAPPDPSRPNEDWVSTRSQLTIFDLHRGGPGRVVVPQKNVFIESLAWAPDTDRLAYFAWDLGAGVRSGIFYAFDAQSGDVTAYPHRGLDLASERERGFVQKPERVMWVDGRLAVLARKYGGSEPRFTYRDITGPGRPGYPGKADWFLLDAQGNSENLTAQFEIVSSIPMHADADTITVLADGDAWRVGPGRTPQNLTAGIDGTLQHPPSVRYSTLHRPFRAEAMLQNRDDDHPGFVLIDLAAGSAQQIDSPAADAEYLAGSVEAGAILFRHSHADGADLILKHADGRQTIVDRLNEHLAAVAKSEWTTITYTVDSHVGRRELESCVLLPPGYEPGRRYPVIVEVYPSRGANCTSAASQRFRGLGRRSGPYSLHLLAARGYIVFKPNTSREVTRTESGPLGGMTDIVLQGVDALIEQGYADAQRIGLMGFSQGGFSSLWVASQTERFKAVVSLNSWADMYGHYFDATYLQRFYSDEYPFMGSAGRYESTAGSDFSIGKKPFEVPGIYVRNSPLFRAPKIVSPVLLIHSDMDTFALAQYERMFTALRLQGKRARFLRYWGEGHGPSSPANIRHMWNEIFQWFDRYVLTAPDQAPRDETPSPSGQEGPPFHQLGVSRRPADSSRLPQK